MAQGFRCESCIDIESFERKMSETPDISMDLLEIEDIVPPPEIESVFLKRKVKKSFLGRKMSKTMWPGPRS